MRIFIKYILPGLAFFLCARAAQLLTPTPDAVISVWPAAGVGFAAFYLLGFAPAAGIIVADTMAAMAVGHSLEISLLLATGNTFSLGVGGLILRKTTGKKLFLDSLNGMLRFITTGPILSAALAALLGIMTLKIETHSLAGSVVLPYWTWYVSDMTGIVLIVPLITAWTRNPLSPPSALRSLEGIGMFCCAAALSHFVFSSQAHIVFDKYPLPFVFIPIMAWATFRTSHKIITLLLALIFFYGILCTMAGQGHFATLGFPFSVHILQIFTASAALTSMIIHSMVDSLKTNEIALHRINEELEERVNRRTRHLQKALTNLENAEASYRTIFENAIEGIYRADINGRIIKANKALASILGYPDPTTLTQELKAFQQLASDKEDIHRFLEIIATSGQATNFEARVRRRDGAEIWLNLSCRTITDKTGKLIGTEGILQDITKRKLSEQELERRASSDPLTGAANRHFFEHSFKKMLAQAKRTHSGLALLFMDLDDFKGINDTHGHGIGDDVLRETVNRVRSRLRDADLIARVGGDEFAMLIHNIDNREDASQLANDILTTLSAEYSTNNIPIHIGASIGGSLYPIDGQDMETMLEHADTAMYHAKNKGKGKFALWDADSENTESNS